MATVWDVVVRWRQTAIGLPVKFRSRPSLGASPSKQQEACQPLNVQPTNGKWLIWL
jgi:hypothetical protein